MKLEQDLYAFSTGLVPTPNCSPFGGNCVSRNLCCRWDIGGKKCTNRLNDCVMVGIGCLIQSWEIPSVNFTRVTGGHRAGGFQHPKIMMLRLLQVSCHFLMILMWVGG